MTVGASAGFAAPGADIEQVQAQVRDLQMQAAGADEQIRQLFLLSGNFHRVVLIGPERQRRAAP